jgi:tRNA nucleotidyltransferase/poly(A) polymerase
MLAHDYARHVPAHTRIGRFVADESRLRWVFPFLHHFKEADVLIHGGTSRDAVLGRVPHGVHVLVHGVPEHTLHAGLQKFRAPQDLDIKIPSNKLTRHHTLPLIHDLARRDATVNAMAYSIRDGVLHDPFDGLKDIEEMKLRTIGDAQAHFHEDPSKMTRFLRLAAELGFTIEDSAWKALTSSAHKLNRLVSDENGKGSFALPRTHVGTEFLRALKADPAHAFQLFEKSGVLSHITPELLELHKLEHLDGRKAINHLEEILHYLHKENVTTTVIVAAILSFFEEGSLHVLSKLNHRLHLPLLDDTHFSFTDLTWLLEHRRILETTDPELMSHAEFEKIFGGKRGDELLALLRALYITSKQHTGARERLYHAKRLKEELLRGEHPKLLKGRDLLSLGLQPGPHIRSVMMKIRDAQLSGKVSNKIDALDFARHLMSTSDI